MTLHIGDLYRVTATFKNTAGTPTNPTTVVFRLRKPDGVETTPAAVSDGAGVYYYDIAIDQVGAWGYAFVGTGAVTAAEPGEFYVTRSEVVT